MQFVVAIPSDSGQVSTSRPRIFIKLSEVFGVAIPSDSGQVSTWKEVSREGRVGLLVAIPSDSGQVSTVFEIFPIRTVKIVAIPSDSGQVSTGRCRRWRLHQPGGTLWSQSLLIQGRFQQKFFNWLSKFWNKTKVAIPSDSGQVSTRYARRWGIPERDAYLLLSQSLLIQGRFQQNISLIRVRGRG